MSDSNSPDPLSLHEKGPVYSKLISKVSDTSEGGLETIIHEDMLARGWLGVGFESTTRTGTSWGDFCCESGFASRDAISRFQK
jgi:hypothetical protein